jgi:hypothetical protein
MKMTIFTWFGLFLISSFDLFSQDAYQEFKVKRINVFEFTKKPEMKDEKNTTTISFTVKEFCDVTVAIENSEGKILRHLASGVLGDKAPEPFKKSSLEQTITWDNKDDQGKYLDDKANLKIRVSLGLQAEYEKDLYYSPYKRISSLPVLYAAPEGIYVYEGMGRDHVRLYGHDGIYNKSIYPFPASQLKNVKGLNWVKAPDGHEVVEKESVYKQTMLTSGENDGNDGIGTLGMEGVGVTGLAVKGKRIALAFENINRLSTDGSSGGFPLKGSKTGYTIKVSNGQNQIIGPTSMAFSPDGKVVYMTGYMWQNSQASNSGGSVPGNLPAIFKVNYDSDEEISVFAGFKSEKEYGSDDSHFSAPTSVDTDQNGNVYVSDFANDRIQIFDSSAKLIKSISVKNPAKVLVHQKTGEIYVFSWAIIGIPFELDKKMGFDPAKVAQKAFVYSPYPELKLKQEEDFPLGPGHRNFIFSMGQVYQVTLDSWAEEPTIWVVGRKHIVSESDKVWNAMVSQQLKDPKLWESSIKRVQFKKGKWEVISDFNSMAKNELIRTLPPERNIQQLYFNPKSEKLYIGEADSAPTTKAFMDLIEVDPVTNKTAIVKLPFNPQDIDFDINGLIYMRTMNVLGRFDLTSMKEIPFDYGDERSAVGCDGGIGGRATPLVSGIMLPATNAICYHQGGLSVNVNGDIAVACHNRTTYVANPKIAGVKPIASTTSYAPMQFQGRLENPVSICVHVWEKNGKVKSEDVVKGSPQTDGIFIDKDSNIYMMTTASRMIEGKPVGDGMASTLIKFKNNSKGKFLSPEAGIPLPLNKLEYPSRPQDIRGLWVENAEWMYGGVGFGAHNGSACCCWFARWKLDYFARSIVPEPLQYSIGVVDSAGNLILKIGQYGNEDSKGKNSKEPLGGDEVGLFHPCFVATQTDRRIFVSDIGNEKVFSVKLKYVVDEILLFKK